MKKIENGCFIVEDEAEHERIEKALTLLDYYESGDLYNDLISEVTDFIRVSTSSATGDSHE